MERFDLQPHLVGDLLEMRPLRPEDWEELFAVAADPLIWEVHPAHERYKEEYFREYFQEALESEREELREELIAEVGTPRMMTYTAQLDGPLEDGLRYPAKLIEEFPWERELPDGHVFGLNSARAVWKEPLGVVGAIVPWNFPFEVTINKIGQILATGNTTVLKPAPDTPWNATRLGRLVAERTDIPAGVFNVVTSSDHLVGE